MGLSLHRDGSGQRAEVVVAMDPAGRWGDSRRQSRGGPGARYSIMALPQDTKQYYHPRASSLSQKPATPVGNANPRWKNGR